MNMLPGRIAHLRVTIKLIMKMRNPIYLPLALALVAFLGLANHNGWSLLQTLASRTWQHSNPSTQHK